MKNVLLFLFVLMISMQVQSQEKIVSGIISDETGLPLPGVNVLLKGTTNGTQTDFDGNYTIKAKLGDILSFTFVGYVAEERIVSVANIISFSMQPDSGMLEEVVITALGIKRKSRRVVLRGSSSLSGKIKGEHIYNSVKFGQLTAGEINDLEKWSEWLEMIEKSRFKRIQNIWNFNLRNKVVVSVTDELGNPINNAIVSLYKESTILMKSRTDFCGKAILFLNIDSINKQEYYVIQTKINQQVVGKKITKNHKEIELVLERETMDSNDIDIMFTIDATGSMGDEMNYLKAELKNIIKRLDEKIEQKRVALIFYRDKGDEFIVRDFDFNSNINDVQNTLKSQEANGGGDYEEAVEEALRVSMSKSWNIDAKAKLLFLFLDAPPHITQENVIIIKNQIKLAQEKGIKIIPIVASDANKEVEFLMRFFSVSTNGTYVFLTDDSGIGNSHLKPSTKDFKVEKLNDLIVRLIEKYAGIS